MVQKNCKSGAEFPNTLPPVLSNRNIIHNHSKMIKSGIWHWYNTINQTPDFTGFVIFSTSVFFPVQDFTPISCHSLLQSTSADRGASGEQWSTVPQYGSAWCFLVAWLKLYVLCVFFCKNTTDVMLFLSWGITFGHNIILKTKYVLLTMKLTLILWLK